MWLLDTLAALPSVRDMFIMVPAHTRYTEYAIVKSRLDQTVRPLVERVARDWVARHAEVNAYVNDFNDLLVTDSESKYIDFIHPNKATHERIADRLYQEFWTRAGTAAPVQLARAKPAYQWGAFEITLPAAPELANLNPWLEANVTVNFTRPTGTSAMADAFYDGNTTFRVRAYADTPGTWSWTVVSNLPSLDGLNGTFPVVTATDDTAVPFRGKLRVHPADPRQFAYDNGDWFLHLGDTGYRYVISTEPRWQGTVQER